MRPLTLTGFAANRKYHDLSKVAEERGRADELNRRVAWLWEQLQRRDFNNGLSREENAVLWRTAIVGLAVVLVSKGPSRIDPDHKLVVEPNLVTSTCAAGPDDRPNRPNLNLSAPNPPSGNLNRYV